MLRFAMIEFPPPLTAVIRRTTTGSPSLLRFPSTPAGRGRHVNDFRTVEVADLKIHGLLPEKPADGDDELAHLGIAVPLTRDLQALALFRVHLAPVVAPVALRRVLQRASAELVVRPVHDFVLH